MKSEQSRRVLTPEYKIRKRRRVQAFKFDSVDSTNEAAKRLLREGKVRERAYVLAREQTCGKGSNGRGWISPRDAGVYVSVVRCAVAGGGLPSTTEFTLAAGVACAEVLERVAGIDVRLKPVNDLYVGQRKLGGVLCEAVFEGDAMRAVIVGLGINVGPAERRLPAGSAAAVCLEEILTPGVFRGIDVAGLVEQLVDGVDRWVSCVVGGELGAVRDAYGRRVCQGMEVPEISRLRDPLRPPR